MIDRSLGEGGGGARFIPSGERTSIPLSSCPFELATACRRMVSSSSSDGGLQPIRS